MKDPSELDLGKMDFFENDLIINLRYRLGNHDFDMIYHKEKDKVMLLKDGTPAGLDRLSKIEVESYKEALEICICYHHNKEDEQLH